MISDFLVSLLLFWLLLGFVATKNETNVFDENASIIFPEEPKYVAQPEPTAHVVADEEEKKEIFLQHRQPDFENHHREEEKVEDANAEKISLDDAEWFEAKEKSIDSSIWMDPDKESASIHENEPEVEEEAKEEQEEAKKEQEEAKEKREEAKEEQGEAKEEQDEAKEADTLDRNKSVDFVDSDKNLFNPKRKMITSSTSSRPRSNRVSTRPVSSKKKSKSSKPAKRKNKSNLLSNLLYSAIFSSLAAGSGAFYFWMKDKSEGRKDSPFNEPIDDFGECEGENRNETMIMPPDQRQPKEVEDSIGIEIIAIIIIVTLCIAFAAYWFCIRKRFANWHNRTDTTSSASTTNTSAANTSTTTTTTTATTNTNSENAKSTDQMSLVANLSNDISSSANFVMPKDNNNNFYGGQTKINPRRDSV